MLFADAAGHRGDRPPVTQVVRQPAEIHDLPAVQRSRKYAFALRWDVHRCRLCLAATLLLACSVDTGKLRAPTLRDAAAVVHPLPDADNTGGDGIAGASEVARPADGPDAPVGSDEVARGVDGPDEHASGGDGGSQAIDASSDDGDATGAGGTGGGQGGSSEVPPDNGGAGGGGTGGAEGDADDSTDDGFGGAGAGGGVGGDNPGTGGGASGGVNGGPDALSTGEAGLDGGNEVGAAGLDPDLVLWYAFDESSGTTAYDSAQWGGIARNATLAVVGTTGTATFSATRQVGTHALSLTPSVSYSYYGGYAVVPSLNTLAPDAVTISLWVNLAAATSTLNWERLFDFGDSSTAVCWFNLAARSGSTPYGPIFAMSSTGHATADQERLISTTALTPNVWHHLAIVLPTGATYTGVMYLDGVVVASNNAMTLHLSDIGATANNWLGRSQFTSDPYFDGLLDDLRVYKRALSQDEIVALMALRQ